MPIRSKDPGADYLVHVLGHSSKVPLFVSVGPSRAVEVGELSSDSGRGTWHADVREIGICSGVWSAQHG
jgi:hypothetical protein